MNTYNGFKNWETWNVALMLNNTNKEMTDEAIERAKAGTLTDWAIATLDTAYPTHGVDFKKVAWNEVNGAVTLE